MSKRGEGQAAPDPEIEALEEIDWTVFADRIRALAALGERMKRSGLNWRAQVILLHDMTGVSKRNIRKILEALPELAKRFVN